MTQAQSITGFLWRWTRRLLALAFVLALALAILVWTGTVDRWARTAIIGAMEEATGGRVELERFHFAFLALRAEMHGFTLHGREPEGTPPLFHADLLMVDVRVESLWRRKFSLDEVHIARPAIHVRIEKDGSSNAPVPRRAATAPPGKPLRERIFDVVARKVTIEEGEALINQLRLPLVAQGADLHFTLAYQQDATGTPQYDGDLRWRDMKFVVQRYIPTATDLSVKFSLTRESFRIQELVWKLRNSTITVVAARPKFAEPLWQIRYGADLEFADLRRFLRMPNFPAGRARTTGSGEWREGKLQLDGKFNASGIGLRYTWFRALGVEAAGSYRATNHSLAVPDVSARVLGGTVRGRVDLQYAGMKYSTRMSLQGMKVAALLAAVDHPGFPISAFHWDGTMDAEAETTWRLDFQSLDSRGVASWLPPAGTIAPGAVPASAHFDYHYSRDRAMVELRRSHIVTPASRLEIDGRLGAADSALLARLDTMNLLDWNDFIHALRGPDAERTRIAGQASFNGTVIGDVTSPVFHGAVKLRNAQYGNLAWDQVDGELTYGAAEFRFDRVTARRGRSTATLDVALQLHNWAFLPESNWLLTAELTRTPTDGIQSLFGTKYPASALLTGQFRARGTRAQPEFSGNLDFSEVQAAGLTLDRVTGQLRVTRQGILVTRAEARKGHARVTGDFSYRFSDANVVFNAIGTAIALTQIDWLAAVQMPLRGTLSFALRGEGPLIAPHAEGSASIAGLGVGEDNIGNFEARLRSDGRLVKADLVSAMEGASAEGNLELTLSGDYPLRGEARVKQVDLDVFLQNVLHLPHESFTGHSRVDGTLKFHGPLANPRALAVDADLSRLTFGYESVRLENEGPVQLTYSREEVQVKQARLRGPETDFQFSGAARFPLDAPGQLALNVTGLVNLKLISSFIRDLEATGAARINAAIEGTTRAPRITGRMTVDRASAVYGEFPVTLSNVGGDLVFDATRMTFENLTAEAGGGRLALSGSVTYGDGPFRYDLGINAMRVRIRYPQGMSWLLGGALRFAGTRLGGLLSGRVLMDRLLLSEGFDFGGMLVTAAGARGPATTSPFLRNLQFDIEAVSSPDARLEWAAARFECEAQLRVRGTWERPILLGHIHLLTGEMNFRDNRYTITRGDINFSNPSQIDPELNIEATTSIQQYEVTLNFSGRASRLQLAYRSDPPLPSNDIIALLALGRTGEESDLRRSGAASQTAGEGATQVLSEAISSQIGGRIERLFGVSRFRIDPLLAGTGTDPNATARITVEQQVTRDLVVTYITNVSSTQQQIIQVEYAVNRDVSIIGLRDHNGTFGFDIKFKKRFR